MTDEAKSGASEGAAKPAAAHAPGAAARKVPAFPEGEAVFPEMEPLTGSADLGHWVLTGLLWALSVVCGAFVVVGCVKTLQVIGQYYG